VEEDKKEEKKRINEGIEALWVQYNEFKSVRNVLDPNYDTFHEIALKSIREGVDAVSAVQDAKDAGIIFQTPSSSSKDHISPTAKAKAKAKSSSSTSPPTRGDALTAGGTGGSETNKRGRPKGSKNKPKAD